MIATDVLFVRIFCDCFNSRRCAGQFPDPSLTDQPIPFDMSLSCFCPYRFTEAATSALRSNAVSKRACAHIAGCHHKLNPSCEGGLGRTDGASAAYRLDYEIEFGGGDVSLQYARFKSGSLPSRRLIILIVFSRGRGRRAVTSLSSQLLRRASATFDFRPPGQGIQTGCGSVANFRS